MSYLNKKDISIFVDIVWDICKWAAKGFRPILPEVNCCMKRVAIESPYAGDIDTNIRYAKACVKDCLRRGEAPYASHLFFTQDGLLDDNVPDERKLGMEAGKVWEQAADSTVVYIDLGISSGMKWGMEKAKECKRSIEMRSLGENWDK